MRSCWLAVLALAACARPFDNPLDPAGPGLAAPLAEQAGVHAIRLKSAPIAHPTVTSFAYFRQHDEEPAELAGEAPAADPTFVDQAVSPGNSYVYTVRAKSAAGVLSAPSPAVTVAVADTPSVDVSVKATDIGRVEVTVGATVPWITAIELRRSSDSGSGELKRDVAAGSTVTDDVDEGMNWHWSASPKDATGELGPGSDASLQLAWPAPTGISLERRLAIPDVVHLEWGPVAKAVGYLVESATSDIWDERGRPTATTFDAEGLAPRTQYQWRIRAIGANGKTTVPSEGIFSYVPDWVRLLQGGVSDPLPGPNGVARAAIVQSTEAGNIVYAAITTFQGNMQVFRRTLDTAGPWRRVYDAPYDPLMPVLLNDDGPTIVFPFGRTQATSSSVVTQLLQPGSTERTLPYAGTAPVPREEAPALLLSDRTTVFVPLGAYSGTGFADALSLRLDQSPIAATVVPGALGGTRRNHAAAVLANDEVWIYGPDPTTPLMHVNAANPGEWTVVDAPAGPGARREVGAGMLATSDGNGFFLTGGRDSLPLANDTLWRFDAGSQNWTFRNTNGPAPRPGPIALAHLASDDSSLVGVDGTASYVLDLSGTTATWNRTDPPPPPRTDASMAFDSAKDRLFVYGGFSRDGVGLDDTWMLEPDRTSSPWHLFPQDTARPTVAPTYGALAWDGTAGVLHGAFAPDSNSQIQLWNLDPDGDGLWRQVTYQFAPTGRRRAVLACDRGPDGERSALWLVGGITDTGSQAYSAVVHPGDANPKWETVDIGQAIPFTRNVAEKEPMGCFDDNARSVNQLGFSSTDGSLDVWTLPLADQPTWLHLKTSPAPPATFLRAVGCSPSEGSIYALLEFAAGGAPTQELWRIDVSGESHVWAKVESLSQGPGRLFGPSMVGTDWALWFFGGSGLAREPATFTSDLWRISLR